MSTKPRLLDLFSGAGGCGMGYHLAGFDVQAGIDIHPQKNYPFDFIQADALEYLAEYGHEYDFIHASPPCQAHSTMNNIHKKAYADFIPQTRSLLQQLGIPYVIENVVNAPLKSSLCLCGTMFRLNIVRHRIFEFGFDFYPDSLPVCCHQKKVVNHGRPPSQNEYHGVTGHFADFAGAKVAMGIDWMNRAELAQAIPPAYTQYIGAEWLKSQGLAHKYPSMGISQKTLFERIPA
jgi:DNA (cytosine-5)-methyltransferase 1